MIPAISYNQKVTKLNGLDPVPKPLSFTGNSISFGSKAKTTESIFSRMGKTVSAKFRQIKDSAFVQGAKKRIVSGALWVKDKTLNAGRAIAKFFRELPSKFQKKKPASV